MPVEIERASGSQAALGLIFVIASVLSVFGQMPLNRLAARMGRTLALGVGYGLQAAAFLWVAVANTWESLMVAVIFVIVLSLGQMLAVPVARDVVGVLAAEQRLGTYFGVLNSFGGLAVLVAATALGPLFSDPASSAPWLVLTAALTLAGGIAVGIAKSIR